ncbi:MAG: hypothetical protein ACK5Y2_10345 [Bdellovibrionales bacterium]
MTLDFLPPQAYTKETLLKAYNWLQDQTDQVREMASTPDHLVSLYLKATRHGAESAERPSLQNFKSELKSLAGMMGDLEKKPKAPTPAQAPAPQTVAPVATATPPASAPSMAPRPAVSGTATQMGTAVTSGTPGPTATVPATAPRGPAVDELTQTLIREVKTELNLSSDHEALRMLVKIGYQKVRSLYK